MGLGDFLKRSTKAIAGPVLKNWALDLAVPGLGGAMGLYKTGEGGFTMATGDDLKADRKKANEAQAARDAATQAQVDRAKQMDAEKAAQSAWAQNGAYSAISDAVNKSSKAKAAKEQDFYGGGGGGMGLPQGYGGYGGMPQGGGYNPYAPMGMQRGYGYGMGGMGQYGQGGMPQGDGQHQFIDPYTVGGSHGFYGSGPNQGGGGRYRNGQ